MLSFKMDHETGVLEVTERFLSFTSTKATYWYFNVKTWHRSTLGNRNEVPRQPMRQSEIDWVKQHHLPKVNNQQEN